MGHLISVIAKYIQGLFSGSEDLKEKKQSSIMIQFLIISVFAVPYAFVMLPPDITVIQVISAFIAFLLIVIFTLRVLKYFKIM
jgi:Ca2+/Na+ antiporter